MRWKAVIFYRTDNGIVDVEHELLELADIHDRVEAGPHWDCIEKIEIVRINHRTSPTLTVEAAARC